MINDKEQFMISKNDLGEDLSKTLYVLRAYAIICVAAAHCGNFIYPQAEIIRSLIGTMGVPCFMICSGYFFNYFQDAKIFWKKKIRAIIIPWIVWGGITFSVMVVHGGKVLALDEAIRWIIGYKTWLYFVPVLLSCFVLFRISVKKSWLALNLVLFVCSWSLTYTEVFMTNNIITLYQIPFNYTGFFMLGYILKEYDLKKLLDLSNAVKIGTCACFIALFLFYGAYAKGIGYWRSLCSIPFELIACIVMFWFADILKNKKLLYDIGRKSFFIYFVHMEIGNGLARVMLFHWLPTNLGKGECIIAFIKPIVIVVITYLVYICIKKVVLMIGLERYMWIISV